MTDVEKREKVISGLEYCLDRSKEKVHCGDCPYWQDDFESGCHIYDMIRDALDLLKEQEPRVLTVDELNLAADESVICYVEFFDKLAVNVTAPHLIGTGKWVNIPYLGTVISRTARVDAYNREWRCWNHKPTDEQRKAVPWDD